MTRLLVVRHIIVTNSMKARERLLYIATALHRMFVFANAQHTTWDQVRIVTPNLAFNRTSPTTSIRQGLLWLRPCGEIVRWREIGGRGFCGGSSSPDAFSVDQCLYWLDLMSEAAMVLLSNWQLCWCWLWCARSLYMGNTLLSSDCCAYYVTGLVYLPQSNVSASSVWDLRLPHGLYFSSSQAGRWTNKSLSWEIWMIFLLLGILDVVQRNHVTYFVPLYCQSPKLHCYPVFTESGAFLCLWFFAECS